MTGMLSEQDVRRLLEDPSPESRAETAAKVAGAFSSGGLGDDERQLAQEIFRIMVRDAETRVREALSENLKNSPDIPKDVAVSLAEDVATVALPVLEYSSVLSDEELIQIVRMQDGAKQRAIARRADVSEGLSDALVESGDEGAVATLVGNENARISDAAFEKVLDRFGDSEAVQQPLVDRSTLPVQIAEKLVSLVSSELQNRLILKNSSSGDLAARLILKSREEATVGLSLDSSQAQVAELVWSLDGDGRLDASLVIRAVCMGDLPFFEHAVAVKAGIPVDNARILIHDEGGMGLERLYVKSGMPKARFPAVRAAIDVMKETQLDGEPHDRERFSRRLIERILTQSEHFADGLEAADLDYLLARMDALHEAEHG